MSSVRWLQTSDVHLRADRPERRHALETVFAAAEEHRVDAIAIAGDLFDRSSDAVGERAFDAPPVGVLLFNMGGPSLMRICATSPSDRRWARGPTMGSSRSFCTESRSSRG